MRIKLTLKVALNEHDEYMTKTCEVHSVHAREFAEVMVDFWKEILSAIKNDNFEEPVSFISVTVHNKHDFCVSEMVIPFFDCPHVLDAKDPDDFFRN